VLVGTISVEVSEMLSRLLERRGVPHDVLNAKNHEREAEIIMNAGQKGTVTIATNMAGRGVDIKLGEGVREARRPVRARHRAPREPAHRQPAARPLRADRATPARAASTSRPRTTSSGSSPATACSASSTVSAPRGRGHGAQDAHEPVEKAQKKVEELNFLRRKNVLKYDEVMNEQRRIVYEQRGRILHGEDQVRDMLAEVLEGTIRGQIDESDYAEDWDLDGLFIALKMVYDPTVGADDLDLETAQVQDVVDLIVDDALGQYDDREELIGAEQLRDVERAVLLQVIDGKWKEHLHDMDYLQEGIHLRALGQRDPLVEYKNEGFALFQDMLETIKSSTVTTLMKNRPEDLAIFTAMALEQPVKGFNYTSGADLANQTSFTGAAVAGGEYAEPALSDARFADQPPRAVAADGQQAAPVAVQQRVVYDKVGRNDPCPCGSGKKYKKCHGA
jgi:preprotein translocase subunit SecA